MTLVEQKVELRNTKMGLQTLTEEVAGLKLKIKKVNTVHYIQFV